MFRYDFEASVTDIIMIVIGGINTINRWW